MAARLSDTATPDESRSGAAPGEGAHGPIEAEFGESLRKLRRGLIDVFRSVDADPEEPQKVSRRFALNKNLTWKLSRLIRAPDVLEAVRLLPGRNGMKIALDALESAGAERAAVLRVREATEQFDALVRRHSGDRHTLEAMVAGPGSPRANDASRGEPQRKLAFRGNSAIWGVQARVQLSMHWLMPSATPGKLDHAVVAGLLDFKRLRADTRWTVAMIRRVGADWAGEDPRGFSSLGTHLAAADGETLPPLIQEFCSDPLPHVKLAAARPGMWRMELQPGGVGKLSSLTCVTGWVDRGRAATTQVGSDTHGRILCTLGTPAELLLHDVYVHRDLPFARRLEPKVYGQLPMGPGWNDGNPPPQLPIVPEVERHDRPLHALAPEVHAYHDIVSHVMERLSARADDFVLTRLRLPYPPMPALVSLEAELPTGAA